MKHTKSCIGAIVRYCGHKATFIADVREIGGAVVIHAAAPITDTGGLNRDPGEYKFATHYIVDFPEGGFWKPRLGLFVVPENQVTDLRKHKDARRVG